MDEGQEPHLPDWVVRCCAVEPSLLHLESLQLSDRSSYVGRQCYAWRRCDSTSGQAVDEEEELQLPGLDRAKLRGGTLDRAKFAH